MKESSHRLVHADASDLSSLPDSSVALVVTSPPYPMIEMWDETFSVRSPSVRSALSEADGTAAWRLMHEQLDPVWAECFRVLRPGGWACINIGDATRTLNGRFQLFPNHARVISACGGMGFDILPAVLWRKQTNAPNKFMGSGMLPGGAYVTLEHEYILIMRKGAKRRLESVEQKRARRESAYFWEERNRWFSDIWDFKGARQDLGRPELRSRSAAFPFELPFRLISMYSSRGDLVLDPFVGTGTTVLAAMAAGRDSVGVDTDEALLEAAREDALSARDFLNAVIQERLSAHLRFVHDHVAQGGTLAHVNRPHGFPVMTTQESDLLIPGVEKITARGDGALTVAYGDLTTGDGGTPSAPPGAGGVRRQG